MTILILSEPHDFHASAVHWGVRALGGDAVLWNWADFPRTDLASAWLGPDSEAHFELRLGERLHVTPFDAVWWRRPAKPVARDGSHPDDLAVIRRESRAMLDNLLFHGAHGGTRWVNHPQAAAHAENKLLQLSAAREAGFRIPDTIVSNDLQRVREFFRRHHGRIIYKGFQPAVWENEDGSVTMLRTSALRAEHLEHEAAVRACPGIFQQQIEPARELRVTVMGDRVLAGAIDSQRNGPAVDWRHDHDPDKLPMESWELDAGTAQRCRVLCARLGLAFGCIDLIVDPSGDVHFLEVNEGGQFLWKEKLAPELPMLDSFCRFLSGVADGEGPRLGLAGFKSSQAYLELCAYRRAMSEA